MLAMQGMSLAALDRARKSRDPRFDGKFFIAVTSTRIYCRPVCPVPSPKAANVRYYPTAAAAAEAGYRPCLRCRPEAAPGTPAWLGSSALVRRGLRLIQDGHLDGSSVDDLAERLGIGPRHLHRLFVEHLGASPIAVAQTRRLHFAKQLLDETDLRIADVALASGFGSVRRFNDAFRLTYARAPRDLRRTRRGGGTRAPEGEVVVRLAFRPPYDWDHVRDFLGRRALPGLERLDERGYARTVRTGSGAAVVRVAPIAGEHALRLHVRGMAPEALFGLCATARRVFDLAADPAHIAGALSADATLARLLRRRPGLRIPGAWDPFECAVRAILGQQVSVAAGRTFAVRLLARFGRRVATGESGLTHAFPTPRVLAGASLDGLGLTGARARSINALARAVASGALDFAAPAEEVAARLAALPGCGPWTASYVALRALGEPDAFPAGDLVLRRKAAGPSEPPLTTRALAERAESWRPWRGYATLHLWTATDSRSSSADVGRR